VHINKTSKIALEKKRRMKISKASIKRLFLVGSSFLTNKVVKSHAIEVRYCHTAEGMLRIFVEHYHCSGGPGSGPGCWKSLAINNVEDAGSMNIRDDTHLPVGEVQELFPSGIIEKVEDREFGLPGCSGDGSSTLAASCQNDPTNAWAYYDFPTECDKEVKYTFLKGNTIVLEDKCDLYNDGEGLTITGDFKDEGPPVPYINGEICNDGDKIYRHADHPDDVEAAVHFNATAIDDCKLSTVTTSRDSGSVFPLGSTDVTITATDELGNAATCSFQVIVETVTHEPSLFLSSSPSEAFEKKICTVWPDPHFKPFSYITSHFDFHYGCDVIFLKNNNIEIHLRLDESNLSYPMSVVRSVGVKIGGDILQVTSNDFQFYVNEPQRRNGNDITTNPLPNNSKIGSWQLYTYNSKPYLEWDNAPSPSIELRNPSNTAKIVIQENPRLKSLLVQVSGEGNIFKSEFDETVGMCSHVDSDDLHFYDRDGVIMVPEQLDSGGRYQPSFGEEWQVTDNDTQILSDPVFETSLGDHAKFPKQCSSTGRRNLRNDIFHSSTTSSCTFCQSLWNPVVVETCEFDASVLGCEAMNDFVYSPVFSHFFPGPQPVFGTDFDCINNDDFFFNDEKETCQWIRFKESRRSQFCQYQTVRVNCPLSCGLCCEDDASYKFTAKFGKKDKTKDCEWLGKKKKRQEKWCNEKDDGDELNEWQNGKMIRDACPKNCNFCADLVEVIGE